MSTKNPTYDYMNFLFFSETKVATFKKWMQLTILIWISRDTFFCAAFRRACFSSAQILSLVFLQLCWLTCAQVRNHLPTDVPTGVVAEVLGQTKNAEVEDALAAHSYIDQRGDQLSKGLRKPLGVREIDTAKASPCLSAAGGRSARHSLLSD